MGVHAFGSARFRRLSGAAALGKAAPPVDRRYLVTGMNRDPFALKSSVKSEIISHLQMLYESVAETLPDVRDDSFEPEDAITVAQEGTDELQDGYAAAISEEADSIKPGKGKKKPHRMKKSVALLRTSTNVRYLLPGCMKDHFEQMNASRDGSLPPISFAYFWKVPGLCVTHYMVHCCVTESLFPINVVRYYLSQVWHQEFEPQVSPTKPTLPMQYMHQAQNADLGVGVSFAGAQRTIAQVQFPPT